MGCLRVDKCPLSHSTQRLAAVYISLLTHLSIDIQSTSVFPVVSMKFTAEPCLDVKCSVVV